MLIQVAAGHKIKKRHHGSVRPGRIKYKEMALMRFNILAAFF
jgi:hypothetical protein